MTSYIRDLNRFQLAQPPTWWLRQLHEFDADLVIIPSRQQAYHLIGLRRKHILPKPTGPNIMAPDEAMFRQYGLVDPIVLVSETGAWNWSSTDLRPQLAARAPHRHPAHHYYGWRGVADAVDQRDADAKAARLKWRHEDLLIPRIKAGVRAYNSRTGTRILNAGLPSGANGISAPSSGAPLDAQP